MTFFYDLNKKLKEVLDAPKSEHQQLNERDMSRAAKGYEKYGKEGMQALAKAGREGKSLDPIRAKYDKYDESVEEGSTGDYSAKKARAGKDIGKPGKAFAKIAKSAGERYGSKERGEKVAGAVLAKLRHPKEGIEDRIGDLDQSNPVNQPAYQRKAQSGDSAQAARGMPTKEEMTPKQKSFAALAPPKDKITFADKIAGAKKEVDEMLGDVAAEAIKGALSPKQKKLDLNKNGKLDANDFAMLRKGAKGKEETDEGWDEMEKDVKHRMSTRKVGDVTHGAKHDVEEIPGGRRVTRRVDPNTGHSVGADDEEDTRNTSGEKRGRGRPKGSKKAMGAKGPSGKSKLMTKEADHDSGELKAAMTLLKKHGYKITKGEEELDEKAVSKAQQRFMGMVHATQKGEKAPSKEVAKVAKTMKKKDAEDFASTKHKGLPEKKKPEDKGEDKPKKVKEQGGTDTPTASSGFSYGKGIYDSMNRELESMIAESMSINMSMNTDAEGGPSKSLTVTATDDDAIKLSDLLKNAGLGGGDHAPNVEGGADLDHPGAIEVHGTMDADGADDLADQIRQAVGDHEHGEEPCPDCGHTDCECDHEEVDEAAVDVSDNQPNWPTNTETNDDALQYSGGLNKPKSTGQTTIPVIAGQTQREKGYGDGFDEVYESDIARMREMAGIKEAKKVEEDDMEEGNKFTGNLAKAREAGKTQADLDGDGDLEQVRESVRSLWKQYKINHGV